MSTAKKRKRLGDLLKRGIITESVTVATESQASTTPQRTLKDEGFTENYQRIIGGIRKKYKVACSEFKAQNSNALSMHKHLKEIGFPVIRKSFLCYDNRGKKKTKVPEPLHPLRITFFNGGKAHFPYSTWPDIFRTRAQDLLDKRSLFDNDFAHDSEGIKLFFELDYRSKDDIPRDEDMVAHCLALQEVVKRFYPNNLDFTMWVLTCDPKPKYTAESTHPLIATGSHIIFPNIVINCDIGRQLCHSGNLELEARFGLTNLVDCCYKTNLTSLRPAMCCKLVDCPDCFNSDDMRLGCTLCDGRGKLPSGSIYKVNYKIDTHGEQCYDTKEKLGAYVRENLAQVLAETSIIPAMAGDFTSGYHRPVEEPEYVPAKLLSQNKQDSGKDHVYKKDRTAMSKMSRLEAFEDEAVIKLIARLVRSIHPRYDRPNMVLGSVKRSKTSYVVNMRGSGRNFCRIAKPEGHDHSSNGIYFHISKKNARITQKCYDDNCKELLAANEASIGKLCSKALNSDAISRLFSFSSNKSPKHEAPIGDRYKDVFRRT